MLQLKRVLVKNLLSFEHAEFRLGTYTVIVGPNNSGKTNLLRILSTISENGNFEHQQINRTQKLNPNEPSEIAITLNLDKTEAGMVFQCIFGKDDQVDKIAENMRTLDITIFWDKDQSRIISPKFTLYRFGSGFTISTSRHKSSIAFDIGRILLDPGKYKDVVESWRKAELKNLFAYQGGGYVTLQYASLSDKEQFMEDILEGRLFDTTEGHIIEGLPISARHDSNADTSISRLVRRHKPPHPVNDVSLGFVLNMILRDNITLIGEIRPSYEDLSNSLATLRNREQDKYNDLRRTFKEISGGVEVLADRRQDGTEKILFVEGSKRYDISNSASGHHALVGILYMILGKTSGLIAIDEPEVHLHPTMCLRLHKMLADGTTDRSHVQVLIVTHSTKFVTHEQIERPCEHGLIMVTRRGSASRVHADTKESALEIRPHLFNPEIFFGRCTMIVEGPSDYFVMRAISDHRDGLLGEKDIILIHCDGKGNLPAFIDLHKRFNIPYQAMADDDYDGVQDSVIKLPGDLEAELETMGVRDVPEKADDDIYDQVMGFLKGTKVENLTQSKFWHVFEETIDKADREEPV